MILQGRISPTGGLDFSDLKLHIAPLPSSPFAHPDNNGGCAGARSRGTSDLSSALVTAQAASYGSFGNHLGVSERERAPSQSQVQSFGDKNGSTLSRSLAQLARNDSDNTLDAVLMQESQRRRLESGEESDLLPRLSGEGRRPSKDRSSGGSREDAGFDMEDDEELPFAWAESEIASSGTIVPPVSDSVGAQLLYGMSRMSVHAQSQGANQDQGLGQGQFSYGNDGPPASRFLGGNSSYTGAVSTLSFFNVCFVHRYLSLPVVCRCFLHALSMLC